MSMSSRRQRTPPISAFVAMLGKMPEDDYAALASEVSGPDALSVDQARCERLAASVGCDMETARAILSILSFLYEQLHVSGRDAIGSDTLRDALTDLASGMPDAEFAIPRMMQLLGRSAVIDRQLAIQEIKDGFHPHATGFKVALDFRLKATDDLARIDCLVPLMQVRVELEAEGTENSFVFQMDRRALEALEEMVRNARDQLNAAQSDPRITALLRG